jgi:glycosyltransferase involved in cell wall biosynthesis
VTDDAILAIYVGRLGPEKGLDVAMRALHRVRRSAGNRIRFAVAGEGPFGETVRRLAPPGTIFMGKLTGTALSEFYASADLFVFPSATDTFGNVLLEAMASGLPVLAADSGPTRELLADRTGVTFPAGESTTLAQLILELAEDPEHRIRLARRALAFAGQCTWEHVFDDLIADYKRVQAARLGERRRRPTPPTTQQAAAS